MTSQAQKCNIFFSELIFQIIIRTRLCITFILQLLTSIININIFIHIIEELRNFTALVISILAIINLHNLSVIYCSHVEYIIFFFKSSSAYSKYFKNNVARVRNKCKIVIRKYLSCYICNICVMRWIYQERSIQSFLRNINLLNIFNRLEQLLRNIELFGFSRERIE
jgi:hypothetical protein